MEYNSFYGGRRGASFVIVKKYMAIQMPELERDELGNLKYTTTEEIEKRYEALMGKKYTNKQEWLEKECMVYCFKQGNAYETVNYDEYVIIDTANKNDENNGKIFRRGYEYSNDLGGAIFVGQVQGPAGMAPHTIIDTFENVHNKVSTDDLELTDPMGEKLYRKTEGDYNMLNKGIVPGKFQKVDTNGNPLVDDNGFPINDYNDEIRYVACSIRDPEAHTSTAYVGFKIPYPVIDYVAESVSPYYNRSDTRPENADDYDNWSEDGDTEDFSNENLVRRIDDEQHPFYEKWDIKIPKGKKGDSLVGFRVTTVEEEQAKNPDWLQSYPGIDDDIATEPVKKERKILVYDYYNYDRVAGGDPITLYLGDYNMIENFNVNQFGTVTIDYSHDNEDVYKNLFKWINSISLNKDTGEFIINYNYDKTRDGEDNAKEDTTYKISLTWVKDMDIAEDGTITFTYTTDENNKTYDNFIKWIKEVKLDTGNGHFEVIYNYDNDPETGNPTKYVADLKWVKNLELAEDGTITLKYTTGPDTILDEKIKWIDNVSLSNDGTVTITYNDSTTDIFNKKIKWISNISLTDAGLLTIKYNNGDADFTKTLKWPIEISVNTGTVEGTGNQKMVIHFNDNTTEEVGNPINYIMRIAISDDYHLLVLHSDPARRQELIDNNENYTFDNRNDWQDMGSVKDDDGILIGYNIQLDNTNSNLQTKTEAINYLNTTYPNGLTNPNERGKLVTIGWDDKNKDFYAFDYTLENGNYKGWYFLGYIETSSTSFAAMENERDIQQKIDRMAEGSLWFVIEDF